MRALVQKTDSFNIKSTFWICGIDYDSLWYQLDCLQECSTACGYGNYYDILAFEDKGIVKSAYGGNILTNSDIEKLCN